MPIKYFDDGVKADAYIRYINAGISLTK